MAVRVLDRRGALVLGRLGLPACSALQAAVQMTVSLASARWLGPADRGNLVIATTVGTFLLLVASLGVMTSSRVVLGEPGDWWSWGRYARLAGFLALPQLVLAAAVGVPVLWALSTNGSLAYPIFLAYACLILVSSLLREGLHGLGRHMSAFGIDAGTAGLQLGLVVLAHLLGILTVPLALGAAALAFLVAIVVQLRVGFLASARADRSSAPRGRFWPQAKLLVLFSLPAMMTALGQSFVINGDRILMAAMGSTSQVGIYSAAASLAGLSWFIPTAFSAVVTRRVAQARSLAPWVAMRRRLAFLGAAIALLVSAGGYLALPVLLGQSYAAGRGSLVVLGAAAVPFAVYLIDTAAATGMRDLRTGALGALLGCALLVLISLLTVPRWHAAGQAVAVLVTYCLMAAFTRLRVQRLRSGALVDLAKPREEIDVVVAVP